MYHTVLTFCKAHAGFFLILVVAAAIRLSYLGVVPHGFTWDEAAIGYNGYAVATTRRDEWLERLPVSFRSFGDYKAPLAIYINGLFTVTLGLEQWVVRLPFALSGVAAVAALYWVFSLLLSSRQLALIGAGALALSPWHILYSRTGFESGIALLFVLVMIGAFLTGIRRSDRSSWPRLPVAFWFFAAAFFSTLSLYTYHSAKIAVPLLAIAVVLFWRREVFKHWKALVLSGVFAAILLIPLLKDSLYGSGLERAGVTVFSRESSLLAASSISLKQLFTHLSPGFLLFGETTTLRHGTGVWGVLLPTTFFLVLLALIDHLTRVLTKRPTRPAFDFLITWVLIGLLPAAIATEVPHSNRSLLALPGFIGLGLLGLQTLLEWASAAEERLSLPSLKKHTDTLAKATLGVLLCIHLLTSVAFLNFYFTTYAKVSAADFYDGYVEALKQAHAYELGLDGRPMVDQIYISSTYGQPYIYSLFVRKTDPIWYQGGALSQKYTFLDELTPGDLERSNVLLVAGKDSQLDESRATHLVRGSNGEVRFKLYYLPRKAE